jgi:hypothetical protein
MQKRMSGLWRQASNVFAPMSPEKRERLGAPRSVSSHVKPVFGTEDWTLEAMIKSEIIYGQSSKRCRCPGSVKCKKSGLSVPPS